ncbi:MAG: isopenicillin N synthase family oxygenase [Rhodospirillaceae bacterium]|nr:isopenicillin N synthase family oxygenase [Rhodospirillaceae bacterium]
MIGYATANSINVDTIPVIDVSPMLDGNDTGLGTVAGQLRAAAESTGFFYIANHGVEQSWLDDLYATGRRFFDFPADQKAEVAINRHHRGFIKMGEARMDDNARPDLKESFVWGREVTEDDPDYAAGKPMAGPNNWPAFMPELKQKLTGYMDHCNRLGKRLLQAFACSLHVDQDTFVQTFERPASRGALVWYPPQDTAMGPKQFGVAPHTDYGCLTFVYQDQIGGLQVMTKAGEWVVAEPVPGAFVVNVGDLLARWTNDCFASTPHRVVNATGKERLSIAVFVDPNEDTVIDPICVGDELAKYPPVTVAGHIVGRFDKSFEYRQKNVVEEHRLAPRRCIRDHGD